MKNITIIGFGSWGIALAGLLDQNGHSVTAWDNHAAYAAELSETRQNRYLPDVAISESITITSDLGAAVNSAELFVLALPSKSLHLVEQFVPYFQNAGLIVSASKGLEETRQIRICQYLQELAPSCAVAALTGPSHAEEVLKDIPTAVVAASEDRAVAEQVQAIFAGGNFRVYTSTDLVGAELGGALKNVIALAAGCSDGLGFGDNTKAALITRGIAEITRLGVAMGAEERTFAGLSGLGDLIVTCASRHSRNWRMGYALASGQILDEALAEIGMAVEGVATAKTALELAHKHRINMPIVEEVNKVLFANKSPKDAVVDLMLREKTEEYAGL